MLPKDFFLRPRCCIAGGTYAVDEFEAELEWREKQKGPSPRIPVLPPRPTEVTADVLANDMLRAYYPDPRTLHLNADRRERLPSGKVVCVPTTPPGDPGVGERAFQEAELEDLSPEHLDLYDTGGFFRYCYECDAAHPKPYKVCPACGNPKLLVTNAVAENRADRAKHMAEGWEPTYRVELGGRQCGRSARSESRVHDDGVEYMAAVESDSISTSDEAAREGFMVGGTPVRTDPIPPMQYRAWLGGQNAGRSQRERTRHEQRQFDQYGPDRPLTDIRKAGREVTFQAKGRKQRRAFDRFLERVGITQPKLPRKPLRERIFFGPRDLILDNCGAHIPGRRARFWEAVRSLAWWLDDLAGVKLGRIISKKQWAGVWRKPRRECR